jgi:hypothetical protein
MIAGVLASDGKVVGLEGVGARVDDLEEVLWISLYVHG